jgi:diadenosine tetraphosphate (Ap4A) HIT family hydrolase
MTTPRPPASIVPGEPAAACAACGRLASLRSPGGEERDWYVCTLSQTVVLLHRHQTWPGWCVLMLKEHAEHLHELDAERHAGVMVDVRTTARAIVKAFSPSRINYECLGNVLAHVHWHVIPRYPPFPRGIDPDPGATVWVRPIRELESGVDHRQREEFIRRLRAAGLQDQG